MENNHSEIMVLLTEIRGDVKSIDQRLTALNGSVTRVKEEVVAIKIEESVMGNRLDVLEKINNKLEAVNDKKWSILYTEGVKLFITVLTTLGILKLSK